MYRVEIHRKAQKEIKDLPEDIRNKVLKLIINLQYTPYPFKDYDLKKIKGFKDVYRVRLGDYRIIYRVNDNLKKVTVLEVKSREKAYRDLKRRML